MRSRSFGIQARSRTEQAVLLVAMAVAIAATSGALWRSVGREPAPRVSVLPFRVTPPPDETGSTAPQPAPDPAQSEEPQTSPEPAAASPRPTPTPPPTTPTPPPTRPASIHCGATEQARWCSPSYAVTVGDGRLVTAISALGPLSSPAPAAPVVDLRVVPELANGALAPPGQPVARVRATLTVTNNTPTTFFFPDGELLLHVDRPGGRDVLRSAGDSFRARPGATIEATFVLGVGLDGVWELRGEAFSYPLDS